MQVFFSENISGNIHRLNEEETKHCYRVLRLKPGDEIRIVNGTGGFYSAEIVEINKKDCKIRIIDVQPEFEKRNFRLHIAIAPTKNIDRFEWFLEKSTEIGIDEITPVISKNSERRRIKPERLEKIIISAMKQSIKAYKPKLNEITSFSDFIENNKNLANLQKYIAHCNEGQKANLRDIYTKAGNALILIGPEGDFSREEVDFAIKKKYREITLGHSRLRTETAGVVACHSINFLNFM